MRIFIAICLMSVASFFTTDATALEFEASIGYTQFEKPDNGIWWQNGFHHTLDTSSPSYSIGVTDRFDSGLRWGATYVNLGTISTSAQATPTPDENATTNYKAITLNLALRQRF
jgi:hypothetical protein